MSFHDPYLAGNGEWCSGCFPDGPPHGLWRKRIRRGCNECAGDGRTAYSAERIIADTVAAKRAALKSDARHCDEALRSAR